MAAKWPVDPRQQTGWPKVLFVDDGLADRVVREPGNSEYLEEFPLGFYWSSIRARVHKSDHFALLEIGELDVGGPIYL